MTDGRRSRTGPASGTRRRAALLAVATALAAAASGCGGAAGAPAGRAAPSGIRAPSPSTTTTTTVSTLERPASLGTPARIGGYEVTVVAYAPDATSSVVRADPRNRRPASGRYATAELTVRNVSTEPMVASRDLAVVLVAADGTTTRHWDCTAHLGDRSLFDGARLPSGGRAAGEVCFDGAAGDGPTIAVTSADDPLGDPSTRYWSP